MMRDRLLVVQRTGWGKSMVYFIATRLLRNKGAGLTLLISPLLSLMRNQIEAAARIGLKAVSINSTNKDDWKTVEDSLLEDSTDILLISPERLANEDFRQRVLSDIAGNVGLFVVDEAHCISDWGHDFRPDYQRIVRVLKVLPQNIPVLATTATANDRVVYDTAEQLGDRIRVVRGPLTRESLKLQNIRMSSPSARLAWLATHLPQLEGSGIVYTLTVRDAEVVAAWLKKNGIKAASYHSESLNREALENQLLNNEIKALVATVALGMGFDKPDLGFVIHYQRPGSVVHYYQQVGRAGRGVDSAFGILLHGEEDQRISDYFIRNAFPPQKHVDTILGALAESDEGLSVPQMQKQLNLRTGKINAALTYLTVESPSPVTKIGSKWNLTATGDGYEIDQKRIDEITQIRNLEQSQMDRYMDHRGCLMEFLSSALDDPNATACGKCSNCQGSSIVPEDFNHDLAIQAARFLKLNHQKIQPRKIWPTGDPLSDYDFSGRIDSHLLAEEGMALSTWRDAGWGQLVAEGKYHHSHFDDRLVAACVEMIQTWAPLKEPTWLTFIPSLIHPCLVPDFAERLAKALRIQFTSTLSKTFENPPQKDMENSFQQCKNLNGLFAIDQRAVRQGACLLVDDVVDSGWTLTVAAALLRKSGCSAVYPLALATKSH